MNTIGVGSPFRLAITSQDGRVSSIWRFWTSKNGDDFYYAERETSPDFKVSYHPAINTWRIAMTKEKNMRDNIERVLITEVDAPKDPATGALSGPSIIVPARDLRISTKTLPRGTHFLEIPDGIEAVRIDVSLTETDAQTAYSIAPDALAYLERSSGGTAFISISRLGLSEESKVCLDLQREDYGRIFPDRGNFEEERFVFVSELPTHPFAAVFDLSRPA